MHQPLFGKLRDEGLLSNESFEKINSLGEKRDLSVFWELRTVLYLGVLLLASGLGILVYKNIDTIGHLTILLFIAAIVSVGFYYCFKNKLPFSSSKVEAPNSFFDYVLLLTCLCFIVLIGYWQYQYHVFRNAIGLATFIPMLVLFFCAYFFDHLGILSMAITNLAAWLGIAATPAQILNNNDFNNPFTIITGLLLGIALVLAGKLTTMRRFKVHFEFTYTNFGLNIVFIACLAGLFYFDTTFLLWFIGLSILAIYFYFEAIKKKSFYFLLMDTLYFYTGLSYVVLHLLFYNSNMNENSFFFAIFYFIGTAIALIVFLIKMNKKIKTT